MSDRMVLIGCEWRELIERELLDLRPMKPDTREGLIELARQLAADADLAATPTDGEN